MIDYAPVMKPNRGPYSL